MTDAAPKPEAPAAPARPEVRQCTDPTDADFGSVAVRSDSPFGAWFVGRPSGAGAGGHWETTDELVENWPVLKAPAAKTTKTKPTS
ncbi:hypothetical protein [Mycobacterium sp. 1465703.0]|uniref:hypothetical protein n=1 Tax=Mycobacterium sp. 1465703.0 TaxID=1834078 RepID=UPI0007FCB8C2|nr:hypothetical protein [Mycobacterium sp. 1465703.0]OBI98080.1 hypothetical protein A5625_05185 [Mycobacterium sp. 1465703.0]OBJ04676.1 hypothetical protein A5625_20475 [Mycobacterium sp. 1465703.0]